jgi:hypothetical protein
MAIGCKTVLGGTLYDDMYAMSGADENGKLDYSDNAYSVINFFTYFLLLNTLLPISL